MSDNIDMLDIGLSRHTVTLGDFDLVYFEGGAGRTLMFLHDGEGLRLDLPFLAALAESFHVVVPLHPGFGGSVLPRWMNAVDDFVHAHLALARHLRLDRVILVGASLGGWVAAEMATTHASFIDRLVMIGPVGIKVGPIDRLDVPDIFAMSNAEVDTLLYAQPERWRLTPSTMTDEELLVVAQNRETLALVTWEPFMHNPKLRHRLPTIDRPTLMLRGATDGFVSAEYAARYAGLIPGAQLATIAGAGHLPHVEQPAATVEHIRQFVGA
jgi:pimeloyl-ACP methyl ester carboxylesterase